MIDASGVGLGDLLQGIALVSGLAGQWLIARKSTTGFYAWLVSNGALVAIAISKDLWGLVALYVCYSALCLYGLRRWASDAKSAGSMTAAPAPVASGGRR